MTDAWLSAFATRNLVADRREAWAAGAVDDVEHAIVDYARTVLSVRCQYMWDKTLHDDGRVDTDEARHAVVPSWVWNLTDDTKIDWATGIFHLAGEHDGQLRCVKMQGVEFDANGINRLFPGASADNIPSKPSEEYKPKGGAQPKVESWHKFWLAAMKMLHEGELYDAEKFPTQRTLRDELLIRIDEGLSVDSVKPIVSRIWHAFRE